jgi:SH3-like domain-containing protein
VKDNTVLKVDGQIRKSQKVPLYPDQLMEVVGTSAAYYRVRLPDDTMGYIEYNRIEHAGKPLSRTNAKNDLAIRIKPTPNAAVISTIKEGTPIQVMGQNGSFSYVSIDDGASGWVEAL